MRSARGLRAAGATKASFFLGVAVVGLGVTNLDLGFVLCDLGVAEGFLAERAGVFVVLVLLRGNVEALYPNVCKKCMFSVRYFWFPISPTLFLVFTLFTLSLLRALLGVFLGFGS